MVPTKFRAVGTGVARLEIAPIGSAFTRMTRGLTGKVDDESALVVPVSGHNDEIRNHECLHSMVRMRKLFRGRSPHAARQDSVTSAVGHDLLAGSLRVTRATSHT